MSRVDSGVVRSASPLACFDLDGVLVDSEATKIAAFLQSVEQVLAPADLLLLDVDAYNRAQRGVPRRLKFDWAVQRVRGEKRPDLTRRLLRMYADLLAEALEEVPAMPGAIPFVETWPGPVAVATSAPRDEAQRHLVRLGFRLPSRLFDGSTPKPDALRQLARQSSAQTIYFGDAQADLDAAREAGVKFVAIGRALEEVVDQALLCHATNLEELLPRQAELISAVQ